MLPKYIILLLSFYVYTVISLTTFIDNDKRAEYFELTDNEVPVFRISIPEEEFVDMKKSANILSTDNISAFFQDLVDVVKSLIDGFKNTNFNKKYPGYDFNEILPQLEISEDGFPGFSPEEVLKGFDYNPEHYENDDINTIFIHFLNTNKEFNIIEISAVITSLKVDEEYITSLNEYDSVENENSNDSMSQEYDDNNLEYPSDSMSQEYDDNNLEYPSDYTSQEYDDIEYENTSGSKIITELNPDDIKKQDQETYTKFKTKNATLIVEINGKQELFNKITFSVGGKYSRLFSKPGYNLKIRGDNDLYGRKQFKLRSDINEPTYLRSKIVSDMHNRIGLPSVSANYIDLYINNEYMGFYIISDAYKKSWIEYIYGEENTSLLYKCESVKNLIVYDSEGCVNENEDVTDNSEWISFLLAVQNANSASDLEDIFEIDHFLKEMAIDYLLGSWDHMTNGHNYYMYKQPNGKWIYLSQDFDHDFGQPILPIYIPYSQFFNYGYNIFDVLILKEPERFEKALNEVVMSVFNPSILYPRIDELKQFIRPYVIKDKTPDSNGNYPGRLNKMKLVGEYTIDQWDAYSEFTTGMTDTAAFGLKYWVLVKYRYVCSTYNMECDSTYMNENYEYPVNKELEFDIKNTQFEFLLNEESTGHIEPQASNIKSGISLPNNDSTSLDLIIKNYISYVSHISQIPIKPVEGVISTETFVSAETSTSIISTETFVPNEENTNNITTETSIPTLTVISEATEDNDDDNTSTEAIKTTDIPIPSTTTATLISETPIEKSYQCWAELKGYPCCSEGITTVYAQDEYGDWGYDFKEKVWCGLTPYEEPPSDLECWSEELGYSCCKGCHVYEIDSNGSWGYELHQWCGIPSYCQK